MGGVVLPLSGTAIIRWETAIQVAFVPRDLPDRPTALAVTVTIERGDAGIGWHDVDGLAEELIVGPGPCTQTVHLSLWDPSRCRSLIIRNGGRKRLDVTLGDLALLPLGDAQADGRWRHALEGVGDGMFLDLPFRGTMAEAFWRSRDGEFWDPDRRLRTLVSLAWQYCPGYRDWWSRHGWHPSDLGTLAAAADIPVIGKAQIRADVAPSRFPVATPCRRPHRERPGSR